MLRPRMRTQCQKQRENPCALKHRLLPYCLVPPTQTCTRNTFWAQVGWRSHSARWLQSCSSFVLAPIKSREEYATTGSMHQKHGGTPRARPPIGTRSKRRLADYLSADAVARLSFKPARPNESQRAEYALMVGERDRERKDPCEQKKQKIYKKS